MHMALREQQWRRGQKSMSLVPEYSMISSAELSFRIKGVVSLNPFPLQALSLDPLTKSQQLEPVLVP